MLLKCSCFLFLTRVSCCSSFSSESNVAGTRCLAPLAPAPPTPHFPRLSAFATPHSSVRSAPRHASSSYSAALHWLYILLLLFLLFRFLTLSAQVSFTSPLSCPLHEQDLVSLCPLLLRCLQLPLPDSSSHPAHSVYFA